MPINTNPIYPTDQFNWTAFVNENDPTAPAEGVVSFDADQANKLGRGIANTRDGLHKAKFRLINNSFTAFSPVDSYPSSSESSFWTDHTSWPEVGGTVRTFRERADLTSDATIVYDYQEFKVKGSNTKYRRYSLTRSKANWVPGKDYVIGEVAQPFGIPNGSFYTVTTAGRSKTTEPIWTNPDGTPKTTVTETDTGGLNPTVVWTRTGDFWSQWDVGVNSRNARFTGTFSSEPISHTINVVGDKIPVNARHISITSSVNNLVLNSTDILANGLNGQEVIITNVGVNAFGLTSGDVNNIRLNSPTITIGANESITLRYSSSLGLWLQLNSANVARRVNPVFTGVITNIPVTQALALATDTIQALSTNVYINGTGGANLTLNGGLAISEGIDGQILRLVNISVNTLTFTHGDANNVRLVGTTVSVLPNESIDFVFSSVLGVWLQSTTAGLLRKIDPSYSGTLNGPNATLSGSFVNTPTAVQAIAAAADVITANGSNKLISNTTAAGITLTSAPIIADGLNGQEVRITNTGTQPVVLQDQATLVGSNLKLGAATRSLGPRQSIRLQFLSAIGDWVEIGFSTVL